MSKIIAYSEQYVNAVRMGAGGNTAILIVIISLERFVAICFPMMAERSLLNRYPLIAILLALPLNAAFLSFNFLAYDIISYYNPIHNTLMWRTTLSEFALRGNFLKVYGPVAEVLYRILPVIIVLTCNISTVGRLHHAARARKFLTESQSQYTSPNTASEKQATRMLLGVAVLFLICITPGSIVGLIILLDPDWSYMAKEHFFFLALSQITGVLSKINSAANLVVYVMASRNFRDTLAYMLCCRKKALSKPQTEVSVVPNTDMISMERI